MRRSGVRGLLALAVMVGMGCEGGGMNPDGPSLSDGPYADSLDAFCGLLDRCPDATGIPLAYRDREECKVVLDFAFACRLTTTEVAGGTRFGLERLPIEVSREVADACIAWLEAASCETFGEGGVDNPCAPIFAGFDDGDGGDGGGSGLAGVDEECGRDGDCEDSLYCAYADLDLERGVRTCQVCRPRVGEGEPCDTRGRSCAEGLYCDYVEAEMAHRCRVPMPNDSPCVSYDECASGFCNPDLDPTGGRGLCADGGEGTSCVTFCNPDHYCDEGICRARLDSGASCVENEECRMGLCDAGTCRGREGAPCGTDSDCSGETVCRAGTCTSDSGGGCSDDPDCPSGQICRVESGTCADPLGDGAGCDRDEECASGYCDGSSDVCRARPAIGEPCSSFGGDCDAHAYCSPSTSTCQPRAEPGGRCEDNGCLAPFLCLDGSCQLPDLSCQPASAGEDCALFVVCDDDSWCDVAAGSVCRARFAVGEPCTPNLLRGNPVCEGTSRCLPDELGEHRCQQLAAEGEACAAVTDCVEGTYCVDAVCVGGFGQPCYEDTMCPAGSFCQGGRVDACVPLGSEGAECEDHDECAAGFFCGSDRTCAARGAEGSECDRHSECREALHCDFEGGRVCVPDVGLGAPCTPSGDECGADVFCDLDAGACVARLPLGSECTSGESCVSGYCDGYCLLPMCEMPS